MAGDDFNYEDVTVYTLDNEDEERMLKLQTECTFIWANKEGWPVGVIMSYVWAKGCFLGYFDQPTRQSSCDASR